jgi:VWFA-related protein
MTRSAIMVGFALGMLAAPAAAREDQAPVAPTTRTVYVTAVDNKGQPVTDLTAADFSLKEGGKDREITRAERPTSRLRLAVLVEESVTADTSVRMGIFEFAKRMIDQADIAIITAGLRNTTVVNFTRDMNAIVEGLNSFSLRQNRAGENLSEGILELAREFQKNPAERPAIVAIALETLQASNERPEQVIDGLRKSRAVLNAVTIATGATSNAVGELNDLSQRGQVLGDGTKHTGGRRIEVTGTPGVPRALQQVADDLSGQYLITYVLPDGVKPSDRLSVSMKRRGVTLRAPSRIADE